MASSIEKSVPINPSPGLPTCEIVTIGTELLLGQIMDTNTTYLARELGRTGVKIGFRTAVGDQPEEIEKVLGIAIDRCDMVIITGGLGPTMDDLTREAVAGVAGVDLEFRQDLMDRIEQIFRRSGYQMPENNRRQAFVPKGSEAIYNPIGTAPGFIKEMDSRPVICLPGVPRELEYLLHENVIPWIRQRFGLDNHMITYRVLKTAGISEGMVDRLIGDLIRPGENPEVGLLASMGEIKVRIAARAGSEKEADGLIRPIDHEIRSRLGNRIYGGDDDTLGSVIDFLLAGKGLNLSILETFTGGLAAQELYGPSLHSLIESRVVSDRNRLIEWLGKEKIIPDRDETLNHSKTLSQRLGSDVGLVIMGFPKEDEDKYVIEGCAAAAGAGLSKAFSWRMGGDLLTLRQRGAVIGLNTLRLALLEAAAD